MDCWVDASSLSFDNSLQDVCTRGFKVPNKGIRVSLGNLGIPGLTPTDDTSDSSVITHSRIAAGKRLYEFILCKSGVGRSIVVNNEEELLSERFELPLGYDSAFIKNPSNTNTSPPTASGLLNGSTSPGLAAALAVAAHSDLQGHASGHEAKVPARAFRHDYVLFDASQLLPKYAVQFVFDPSESEQLLAKLCDSCKAESATLWCESDHAALCPLCDEHVHSRNKLTRRHVRVPINERDAAPPSCPDHQLPLLLFCPLCKVPLCKMCRTHGSHSSGSAALHQIVSLKDAYAAAVAETADLPDVTEFMLPAGGGGAAEDATLKQDRTRDHMERAMAGEGRGLAGADGDPGMKPSQAALAMKRRGQWVEEQLLIIDDVLRTVRANSLESEERTIALLESALKELEEETNVSVSRLLGDQIEIRRQLDQLDWADLFLLELRDQLPAADFLYAWLRHCKLTTELSTLGVSSFPEVPLYDLRIEGGIHLLTEAAVKQQAALQRQRALENSYANNTRGRQPSEDFGTTGRGTRMMGGDSTMGRTDQLLRGELQGNTQGQGSSMVESLAKTLGW